MNLDKRTVVLIALSVLVFAGYNYYLQQKYPDYFKPKGQQQTVEQVPAEGQGESVDSPAEVRESPDEPVANKTGKAASASQDDEPIEKLGRDELTFDTATRLITFNQDFSAITSIKLKDYRQQQKSDQLVELLDSPLVIQGTTRISDRTGAKGFRAKREGSTIQFEREQAGFNIVQSLTVPDEGYEMPLTVQFTNVTDQSQELTAGVLLQQNVFISEESGGFGPAAFVSQNKSFIYGLDGSRNEELARDYCEEPEGPVFSLRNENLDYVGFDWHYFLSVIEPTAKLNLDMERSHGRDMGPYCPISIMAYERFGIVAPGESVTLKFEGYYGPKDVDILEHASPVLASSVKFGWFSVIAHPLLMGLKAFYNIFMNYGLAIIAITVILKILFYPLTRAAAVSMKKMQKLQPQMNELRQKYKEDPQRQQRELMAFMSKHKVNPAKGCLPILPQIPVFIAFYNVLSQAIELRHAPFFGWIHDLSAADPYYITPVLLGVGMFIQQKLTPNPSLDKNQEKIMLMMPIIFTVMMLSLPAGMVLYMIANTVVSIFQQQWLNKRLAKQLG
jgi:YidC/Oxa1 family membrane protein insertase